MVYNESSLENLCFAILSSSIEFALFFVPTPLNCTDANHLCTSFLTFKLNANETIAVIQSIIDVLPEDVTMEGNGLDYIFVHKNYLCSLIEKYLTNRTFTVRENDGSVHDMVIGAYESLAFLPNFMRAGVGVVIAANVWVFERAVELPDELCDGRWG